MKAVKTRSLSWLINWAGMPCRAMAIAPLNRRVVLLGYVTLLPLV